MPFKPFAKGQNSHTHPGGIRKGKGLPKPAPAGPGGKFDANDSPGKDENGDGVFGKPVKSAKHAKPAAKAAFAGLKAAKPGGF